MTTPLLTKDKKCPYDLDSFTNTKKKGRIFRAASGIDAYIRITKSAKDNSFTNVFLVVSVEVRELISCVFDKKDRFDFLVQEDARVFAIRPSNSGNLLPLDSRKNKSDMIRQMSIVSALPTLRKMFGDDALRIELSVEYYDECVIFKPNGNVVRADD